MKYIIQWSTEDIFFYLTFYIMSKSSKKALGLAVEFSSTKDDILKTISRMTASSVRKMSKLSTTQLAQILSVIINYKKHERELLFVENNFEFIAEFLSQDLMRDLNNKNIRRKRLNLHFALPEHIYRMLKFNAYRVGNRAMVMSFTEGSRTRVMENLNTVVMPSYSPQSLVQNK